MYGLYRISFITQKHKHTLIHTYINKSISIILPNRQSQRDSTQRPQLQTSLQKAGELQTDQGVSSLYTNNTNGNQMNWMASNNQHMCHIALLLKQFPGNEKQLKICNSPFWGTSKKNSFCYHTI